MESSVTHNQMFDSRDVDISSSCAAIVEATDSPPSKKKRKSFRGRRAKIRPRRRAKFAIRKKFAQIMIFSNPSKWSKRLTRISADWDMWCQRGWPGAVGDQAPSLASLAGKTLGKTAPASSMMLLSSFSAHSPLICIYVVFFIGKPGSVPKTVQDGCYVGQTRNYPLSTRTDDCVTKASASRFGIQSFSGGSTSVTVIDLLAKYGISNFAEVPLELVDWRSFSFNHASFPSKPKSDPNSKAFKDYKTTLDQERARQITDHLTLRQGWWIRYLRSAGTGGWNTMSREVIAGARSHGKKRPRVETSPRLKCSPSKESQHQCLMKNKLVKHQLSFSDSDSDSESTSKSGSEITSISPSIDDSDNTKSTLPSVQKDPPSAVFPSSKKPKFNPKRRCHRPYIWRPLHRQFQGVSFLEKLNITSYGNNGKFIYRNRSSTAPF